MVDAYMVGNGSSWSIRVKNNYLTESDGYRERFLLVTHASKCIRKCGKCPAV